MIVGVPGDGGNFDNCDLFVTQNSDMVSQVLLKILLIGGDTLLHR
jgi:hypothetical protein